MPDKNIPGIEDLFASDHRNDHLRSHNVEKIESEEKFGAEKSGLRTKTVVSTKAKGARSGSEGPGYLTDQQVAQRYGISRATVWRWAGKKADFPAPVALSAGTTRWCLEALIAFEKSL